MIDALSIWISQLNFPIITLIAQLFENDFIFAALIIAIAIIVEKGKKRNMLVLSIVALFLVGTGVKYLIHEIRPCFTDLISKIQCPNSYSFPSSHAVVAFALAAGLWKKPYGWGHTLFAIFVAFSRVYLGVHTMLDIAAGAIIGIAGYLLIQFAWQKLPIEIKNPTLPFLE